MADDFPLELDADVVTRRAEGRPPEEFSSDDPEEQAKVILEESEGRLADGAEKSDDGISQRNRGGDH